MELTQDKIELIQTIVKNDRKYKDNEDLYDDFVNETCKKAISVIESLGEDPALESYLRRVASTSIISVLKNSGRLRRSKSGYMSNIEISLDDKSTLLDYASTTIDYSVFSAPDCPEETVIKKETMDSVAKALREIDKADPEKFYYAIFKSRYDRGLTQKEISNELGISQSAVCKRLYKMMEKIKNMIV